jgi:hypothetical protein
MVCPYFSFWFSLFLLLWKEGGIKTLKEKAGNLQSKKG